MSNFTIKESRIVHELIPGEGNPRSSEGSFLTLKDGRIVFAYSRYNGTSSHDHASCDICAVFSSDNGEHFTDDYVTLARASDYGEQNVMSVSLLRMANGDAGLFYLLKHHKNLTSEVILKRSADEMATFDKGVVCAPCGYPGYFVINNDRVVRLSDGRLIVPVAKHPSSMGLNDRAFYDGRGACYFFESSDDGVTWRQCRSVLNLPENSYSNSALQEPGLIEMPNGVLYAYFRTDMMYHYETVSIDRGAHWFRPQPSRFTGPCSPLHIKRNEYSGKYYALWNPVPEYPGRLNQEERFWNGGRTPFVMAQSDDGYNFSDFVEIENDPLHGYCYPAMHFLDKKTMLIAYCSGGPEDGMCLTRTTIRKITVE